MRKTKIIKFICDILTAIFILGFVLSFFWHINGSFELMPTEEQQEKALIGASISMFITGALCMICAAIRLTCKIKLRRASLIADSRC